MAKNKEFKNFSLISLVLMGISVIYTLMLISFHGDISMAAFFVSAAYICITFYILGIEILKNTNGRHMIAAGRLIEFMPYIFFISFILRRAGNYGTAFWYDIITVILWISIFVLSIIVSRKLDLRKCTKMVQGWSVAPEEKKYKGIGRFFYEIGDWVYAIVWAIFSVMIIQIFVVQLYQIPSESMVPTFLVKDRVIVSKIDCGPKFPLTDVGLPTFRKYKRGDTVVLRNPHYSMDRKSEVKTVTSQLVYMLTFMTVNLNTDENGQMKADPLVKRITGLPGEQLVMQDGVLYVRTEDGDEFIPSDIDAKYATWNLNDYRKELGNRINNYVLTDKDYTKMLDFEEERRNFNLNDAAVRVNDIVNTVNRIVGNNQLVSFTVPAPHIGMLFSNVNEIAYNIYSKNGGKQWFTEFMTSWIQDKDNVRDMYSESNFKLNVMSKLVFGEIILRYCQAYAFNEDFTLLASDESLIENFKKADVLNWYIQGLLDSRNMPVFPANDGAGNPRYLPKDCYFMMGDNRFNSLDLRHSNERFEAQLTKDDPMSITYYSMMSPQYINKKYIIGKPVFTFWPVNRMGKV